MKRSLRQLGGILYHTVSFLWFAIAIVVTFFWIRSYWVGDRVEFPATLVFNASESPDGNVWMRGTSIASSAGDLCFMSGRYRYRDHGVTLPSDDGPNITSYFQSGDGWFPEAIPVLEEMKTEESSQWQFMGFARFQHIDVQDGVFSHTHGNLVIYERPFLLTEHVVIIPYWAITLAISLWPLLWLYFIGRKIRRYKRMAAGLCPKCKYDLRGSVTENGQDNTCPECGSAT